MSDSQKIVKNTTYLTGAFIIQKILAFIYFTILARVIGVENVGKYTFALSYALIWAVFMDSGLAIALVKELSQKTIELKDYLKSILLFKGIVSILIYLLLFSTVYFSDYDSTSKVLVYWAGLVMIIDTFAQTFYAILRSQQLIKYEAVGVVINQFVIISIGLSVIMFFPDKIYLLLVAFLFGSLVNNIVGLYGMTKNGLLRFSKEKRSHWGLWKRMFFFTWPFALATIFTRIYSYIDSVLLKSFLSDKAVGLYSVAYKIPFSLQFIPLAFAAAIYPVMSSLFGKDNEKLRKILNYSLFYLLILVLPMLVGLWVLAPEIITKFYGTDYVESIVVLRTLVLGLFFIFINFPLTTVISSINKQKYNTLFIGITMLINIGANLILIPLYAQNGSAMAFLLSHGSLFIMNFIFIRKILAFEAKKFVINFFKVAFASVIMGAIVLLFKSYVYWVLAIPVGGLVYLLTLFALKIVVADDVKKLLALLRKKPILNGEETE